MNPDQPSREQIEIRITALLLGELPADEAALLRYTIAQDPALQKLHDELQATLALVREAAKHPEEPTVEKTKSLKLSTDRREKLLAHFKTPRTETPKEPLFWLKRITVVPRPVGILLIAAAIVLLAAMLLPTLSSAKRQAMRRDTYGTLSMKSASSREDEQLSTTDDKQVATMEKRVNPNHSLPVAGPQPQTSPAPLALGVEPSSAGKQTTTIVLPQTEQPTPSASASVPAVAQPLPTESGLAALTVERHVSGVAASTADNSDEERVRIEAERQYELERHKSDQSSGGMLTLAQNDSNNNSVPGYLRAPSNTENKISTGTLTQDGKAFYEMGKLDEAKAKLDQALKANPDNEVASYYSDLIKQDQIKRDIVHHNTDTQDRMEKVERQWILPKQPTASVPASSREPLGAFPSGTVAGTLPPTANENSSPPLPVNAPSGIPLADASATAMAPAPAAGTEYTIASGDTLSKIARKDGVTLKALEEANPGVDPKKLRPGKQLTIPVAPAPVLAEQSLAQSSERTYSSTFRSRGAGGLAGNNSNRNSSPESGLALTTPATTALPLPQIAPPPVPNTPPPLAAIDRYQSVHVFKMTNGNPELAAQVLRDMFQPNSSAMQNGGLTEGTRAPASLSTTGFAMNYYEQGGSALQSRTLQSDFVTTNAVTANGIVNNTFNPGTSAIKPEAIDMNEALRRYGELTGRTVLQSSLPSDAEIYVPKSLPKDAEKQALKAALALNGISMVDIGDKFLKALPSSQASMAGGEIREADLPLRKPAPNALIPQPEVFTQNNNFSTFSLNVSDVSFKFAEASLQNGKLPDTTSIRSEEFINAFDYRDPEAAPGQPMAFTSERARYPFAHNRDLLRFAVKAAVTGRQQGRALNLVLLLDNSGSMERADRVAIIREALRVLAMQLQPQDTVSVVTFSRTARLWADGVAGDKAAETFDRVGGITPEGGTNLEEAMRLAYETAHRHYLANGMNRVVLLTDGAANLGNIEPDVLKQKVEVQRKQGIALDCFGIGWEDYNDNLLELLSSNGDGRYAFLNSPEDPAKDFAAKLAGALQIAAADVKVQVEFNPQRVISFRQIGYATHQLTKEQFRDNTVAAGQIAAQESGNALYTIETNPNGSGPVATVHVRYRIPGTDEYQEHSWNVDYTGNARALEKSSPAMRLAATASAFSEWLAASPYAQEVTPDALLNYLSGVPEIYGADDRPKQLETMIREAKSLEGK